MTAPRHGSDAGVTLIEILATLVILPLVMGAIAYGLLAVISVDHRVQRHLDGAAGAQMSSATFMADVSAAQLATVDASPVCGVGTQVLGVGWGWNGTSVDTEISYATATASDSSTSLWRTSCLGGVVQSRRQVAPNIEMNVGPVATLTTTQNARAEASCVAPSPYTDIRCSYITAIDLTVPSRVAADSFTLAAPTMAASSRILAADQNPGYAPLTALSTLCSGATAPFQVVAPSSLTVQWGSTSGLNAPVALDSSCRPPDTLHASGLLTSDVTLSANSWSSSVFYAADLASQLSNFASGLTTGSVPTTTRSQCTVATTSIYECPPGVYNNSLALTAGNTYYLGAKGSVAGYCTTNSAYNYRFNSYSTQLSAATVAGATTLKVPSKANIFVNSTISLAGESAVVTQVSGTSAPFTITVSTGLQFSHAVNDIISLPALQILGTSASPTTVYFCPFDASLMPYRYTFSSAGGIALLVKGGAKVAANGVTLVVEKGSVQFKSGADVCLRGPDSANNQVSLWDQETGGSISLVPETCSLLPTSTFGGVYAPSSTVTLSSDGTYSADFLIAKSFSSLGLATIKMTTP